LLLPFGLQHL